MTRSRSLAVLALTLATVLSLILPASADPADVQVVRDVVYHEVDGEKLRLDAYLPQGQTGRPVVVLVHGGGWSSGTRAWLGPAAENFARNGWVAVTVDYRLAPAHAFPAGGEDIQEAIRFVRARARNVGGDPDRIVLAGTSAGGNLAALGGAHGRGSHAAGARVAAVVSWSGIYDLPGMLTQTAADAERSWVQGVVQDYVGCPLVEATCTDLAGWASPVRHVDPTDPPVLLVHSQDELTPLRQMHDYAARLEGAGIEVRTVSYGGSRHGQQLIAPSWAPVLQFLDEVVGSP